MRLKITLAYDGTPFHGWQRQPGSATVQGALDAAASRIADAPIAVTGASRTDAGVHARGQVAHLDVADRLPAHEWLRALNALLPAAVRVLSAEIVPEEFHARYSAIGKRYQYTIDPRPIASPFHARYAWHVYGPLDMDAMLAAANSLTGEIDQRAFASRPEPGRNIRPVESIAIRTDDLIKVTVRGRSFLRYAVRGMVGTMVAAARGDLDPAAVAELARAGDRRAAPPPAPPHGLCLSQVRYAGDN
jgi:tRNA pseudouridine38-40 synthase